MLHTNQKLQLGLEEVTKRLLLNYRDLNKIAYRSWRNQDLKANTYDSKIEKAYQN